MKVAYTPEQMQERLSAWLAQDTCHWVRGTVLVNSCGRHFGQRLPAERYEQMVKKILNIKPSIAGSERDFFPYVPISDQRLKEIVAETSKDVSYLGTENVVREGKRYTLPRLKTREDWRAEVYKLLQPHRGIFKDYTGRIVCFGSCFATNIGRALREAGKSVHTLVVTEDVNSSHNNLLLLRRILKGEDCAFVQELKARTGADYEALHKEFVRATDIVFTLGNIFHLDGGAGATLERKGTVLACETFENTKQNLKDIFALIREHTKARIIATVSPIPISGYRGTQFDSAIEADCASKAQLLSALREIRKDWLHYLPTFEIFRWLAAHREQATFGADDDNARHLAQADISLVIEALTT